MVGTDGAAKILDFGLAKAFASNDGASPDASHWPTPAKGTTLGVIVGTPSYMSPEQARGLVVDQRTDIWAFGCCLYVARPPAADVVVVLNWVDQLKRLVPAH